MLEITEQGIGQGQRTAVALGIFDGVHLGHRLVLDKAVEQSARGLAPAVFTFKSGTLTTKPQSERLLTEEAKAERLESLGIEYIYAPDFKDLRALEPVAFIEQVLVGKMGCGCAVCGKDFRFGRGAVGDAALLRREGERLGFEVKVLDKLQMDGAQVSSSRIKKLVRTGDIREANKLLGYTFGYTLPVVHGNEIGRTWNFPTINQRLPEGIVLPRFGVYCARVTVGGKEFKGVANVGVKPTIEKKIAPLAETFILNFDGDLYGKVVDLRLDEFLRPEQRFNDVKALRARIQADVMRTAEFYASAHGASRESTRKLVHNGEV
ncbi:MAG: riboflavin biosynthesis protein RibF [Ruminococcus sp.]|nr:riboflavin biosynthesis protein RibF [Ruminococcus sp.]